MPDFCRDEVCEYRERELCAFRHSDLSTVERCANCPGRNRTPIAHQRCPLEGKFAESEAEKKKIIDPKLPLPSSSKQNEDVEASSLHSKLGGMSLGEGSEAQVPTAKSSIVTSGGDGLASWISPARRYSSRLTTSKSPAITPRIKADTPADAHVVTNKRKGELLLSQRDHIGPVRFKGSTSYSTDAGHHVYLEAQKALTIEEALCKVVENKFVISYLKNKPQKILEDLPGTDPTFVERSLDVCSDDLPASLSSLILSSDTCPLEDPRSGRVSSFQMYNPSFLMNPASQGGVGSSRDGIYNSKDPVEIADMDTEFPVEDGQ